MTQAAASADLSATASAEFERYFRHMAARVEKAAHSISEQQLWQKPFPFGNSVGHLILHLTGNLNHYIGAIIASSGYERHREHEFTDTERYPREDVLRRFREAVDMVAGTLQSQDASSFSTPVGEPAAHPDSARALSRLRRSHEQPHRPDELPGTGAPGEYERAARLVKNGVFRRSECKADRPIRSTLVSIRARTNPPDGTKGAGIVLSFAVRRPRHCGCERHRELRTSCRGSPSFLKVIGARGNPPARSFVIPRGGTMGAHFRKVANE